MLGESMCRVQILFLIWPPCRASLKTTHITVEGKTRWRLHAKEGFSYRAHAHVERDVLTEYTVRESIYIFVVCSSSSAEWPWTQYHHEQPWFRCYLINAELKSERWNQPLSDNWAWTLPASVRHRFACVRTSSAARVCILSLVYFGVMFDKPLSDVARWSDSLSENGSRGSQCVGGPLRPCSGYN